MFKTVLNKQTGSVYIGQVRKNKRNGNGKLITRNGAIQDGFWANNKLIGPRRQMPVGPQQWNFKELGIKK